jgi:hypothetical protein
MSQDYEAPFDSIEGAQEYVALLSETMEEAARAIAREMALTAGTRGAERRLDALRLVNLKLTQLRFHMGSSRRLLNDLRTLRRLLLGERAAVPSV